MPIINEAPMSFAPAVAQSPIGPWASTTTVSPIRMLADSAPLKPVEAMSANGSRLFVAQLVRNFRKVRLRVRHEKILSLGPIDRVAEAPAADRFHSFAMAALRPLRREAGAALSAGRDRADQDAIAHSVTGQSVAQFLNHANWLVANHETRLHRILGAKYEGRSRK